MKPPLRQAHMSSGILLDPNLDQEAAEALWQRVTLRYVAAQEPTRARRTRLALQPTIQVRSMPEVDAATLTAFFLTGSRPRTWLRRLVDACLRCFERSKEAK